MKKKIFVIMTSALMLGGSIGFAAASSPLIGAKVQGLFTVQKANGTKIGDAIIINGSAYAPVRAVAEAVGTNLTVEGKKIIMSDNQTIASDSTISNGTSTDKSDSREFIEYKIRAAESEIESAQGAIKGLEDSKEKVKMYPADYPTEQQQLDALAKIDEMIKAKQEIITFNEEELVRLKTLLDEPSTP
ncbi:hypothetical protein NYE33_21905 [Paenibacillus sp. FSL R10-2199]|uniref:hypothetical protein n=1 Tax=Paenibacillus sp. FSL R10-2199 TaxID=2975348 RepID=UPI0030F7B49C